jgi:hypothetical protein
MTRSQFIKKYGGKTIKFKDMPFEHQFSLAWYMAVDGEVWELPKEYKPSQKYINSNYFRYIKELSKEFKKALPIIVEEHSEEKFGLLNVPMKDFIKILWGKHKKLRGKHKKLNCEDIPEIEEGQKDFKTYHKWYMTERKGEFINHTSNKFPSILDGTWTDELIQDGWHRFHVYVEKGLKKMPLVYFL